MEDEDGYMNIDPRRRETYTRPQHNSETKDASSSLLWWKIGLGASLTGIVILIVALILVGLLVSQDSFGTTFLQHPVIFPTHLHGSENSSVLDHLYKHPQKNSCTSKSASCLSTPSEICISTPKNSITAAVNQTVVVPVDIDITKSNWDFVEVHWHHTKATDHDFMLKYDLRSCSLTKTGQEWWQSPCHLFLEVMPVHRWKMSVMMNAWLIIWNVQQKDAGRYQITVKSSNMKDACSFVELLVNRDHEGSRSPFLT